MAGAYGQVLKLRLFLEGVEVPIISATIQSAPNSPMSASIQIPPLSEGTRFLPRTTVHVFFLDFYESESPFYSGKRGSDKAVGEKPTVYENQIWSETPDDVRFADVALERYKLLFGGEVVGFQWSKGTTQRSLVLQCQDFSNYWDYAYQADNTGIFGPGLKAVFAGASTNLFTDFLSSKGSRITQIVASGKCSTFPKLKGLGAGIIRLIEAVGGSYYQPVDGKKHAGQNVFFSLAELRLHLTHMVAAYDSDPTAQKLLRRQGYTGMFNRALGGQGGQTSIRQSMNALTRIIFHEMYAQPCPKFVPGIGGATGGRVRRRLADDDRNKGILNNVENAIEGIQGVYDSLVELDQEDRTNLELFKKSFRKIILSNKKKLKSISDLLSRTNVKARSQAELKEVRSLISTATQHLSNGKSGLDQWYPGDPPLKFVPIAAGLTQAIEELEKTKNITYYITKRKDREPPRLFQQIFRPDIWFGPPPRCNVMFPDQYHELEYQRSFLQEPTRFLLKTNDEFFGEDWLFDKYYFAPRAGTLKKDKLRANQLLRRELLTHELFTGILPVFEKMGEFNVFASRSGTRKGTKKVGLAQRSTNFIYFKHRFNSRQMRVTGRFNPYLAVGFPGLVIDKYVDQNTIAEINELRAKLNRPTLDNTDLLGVQILGNFTVINHTVSQAQSTAQTMINCSYPRQPDESVEFMGIEDVQTVRKKQDTMAARETDVASIFPPKVGSLGPNGGQITSLKEVTSIYAPGRGPATAGETNRSGRLLPMYVGSRGRGTITKYTKVPVGEEVSVSSEELEPFFEGGTYNGIFRAFRIIEEIPRYRREEVDMPAEELIRPGWFGDVWNPWQIGKPYNFFLGTGAITDAQEVGDKEMGRFLPSQDEEAAEAADEADRAESVDDPRREAPIVHALDDKATIQQAVEFLVLTYSYIKQNGLSTEQFIRSYTWRPVASLVDIFGTSNLEFNDQGTDVVDGIEGFHSRAFGPYEDVFGLVGPELVDIVGIKKDTNVAKKGDTRKRKRDAVEKYTAALAFGTALLG